MHQRSFASAEFAMKKKLTRRERFLAEMETVVPWGRLEALIEPHYPSSGRVGRPPIGMERMLRMYFVQQWYGLADEALEDALYDSQALRDFVGIDLSREAVPDATTLLKFRRLLEQHQLTQAMLAEVNAHLAERGVTMRSGTIVDATILAAPSSTKNRQGERDPEMHQTKKGNQWHFGAKAHIGVDAATGLVHSVKVTAANVADVTVAAQLIRPEDEVVHADAGYQGLAQREEFKQAQQQGKLQPTLSCEVALRPGKRRTLAQQGELGVTLDRIEQLKAKIRAKVEHAFQWLKQRCGLRKLRYRGLKKNEVQCYAIFALGNLMRARSLLQEADGLGVS